MRTQLYLIASEESQHLYNPLQLKWMFPIESTEGMITAFKNIISILDYVQKNKCRKDTIDKIIENDIRPIISGIREEYDFFIAGTIMAICSTVDDFSNEDELMGLVCEIMGKFICLLEEARKLFDSDSKEDNDNNTKKVNSIIEQEVDTTNIEEGMFLPKGYKELCALLHENPLKSGSNSYKAQLKRWARYFKMEKGRGRSLVILDIYDEPLPNDDGRKNGNRNIYLKYIETILLKYIYYRQGQVCYTTRNQLWLLLGMINNNYKKIPLKILNYIGLGGIDIGYILIGMAAMIVLSFLLIIILMIKVSKWKKKYSIFMQGKDAKSLEQDIIGLYEDNKFVKIAIEKNKNNIRELFKKHELSFQKFGIVKYDAFQQMGGQLSFSLVLLNENDNGFIINSVHSTEGCYSYSKEIKNGECSISLGEEEKKALNIALGINS